MVYIVVYKLVRSLYPLYFLVFLRKRMFLIETYFFDVGIKYPGGIGRGRDSSAPTRAVYTVEPQHAAATE